MQKKKLYIKEENNIANQAQRHVHEFEGSTKLAEEGA